jgi:hypothetical protein
MWTRLALVFLVLLILPGLVCAQQAQTQPPPAPQKPAVKPPKQEPPAPAAQQPAEPELKYTPSSVAPKPQKSLVPPSAPKPGHPLDPADVDVLTGKNKPSSQRGYGVLVDPYLGYGYPRSTFTDPGGPGSRFTNPPDRGYSGSYISPLAVGRVNNQNFVILGGQAGSLPFVISAGGRNDVVVFLRRGFVFF